MIAGRRKTRLCKTKAEAKAWEAAQNLENWQEQDAAIPTASLLDAANAYLDYSQHRHHPATYAAKRLAFRGLFAVVSPEASPETLSPRTALALLTSRARAAGNAAANKDRKHLAAWWKWCIDFQGFPAINPFAAVRRLPEDSQPHRVPTAEEFWRVYAVANADDKVMLLALLYTGGRRSEPLRWKWEEDVDLTERRIRLSTCKTRDGSRKYAWLTMPAALHDALVTHKLATGGKGHVFTGPKGDAYRCRKHLITRLCRKAGVEPFNFHGIRGLCASLLARGGVPVKEIQAVLMHSNITTTDRYIRRIGGTADILAAAFDAFDAAKEKAGKVTPFPANIAGI